MVVIALFFKTKVVAVPFLVLHNFHHTHFVLVTWTLAAQKCNFGG